MSKRAREYVLSLGRDQVTARQKQVLIALADAHLERYNAANFSNAQICEDVLMSDRQLRRVLGLLDEKGLISYHPGRGAGNFSHCRFAALSPLPETEKRSESGHKEDTKGSSSASAIRKDLNQNQKQDGLDLEVDRQHECGNGGNLPSSSGFDDEVETNSQISRVLNAFEQSPVTTGKARQADVITARKLLRQHSLDKIIYGIMLGSARKAGSIVNAEREPHFEQYWGETGPRVQSLAYFVDAILEAERDPQCNDSYARYLQHALERYKGRARKQPQAVSA